MLLLLGGLALTASNKDMSLRKGISSPRSFTRSNQSAGACAAVGRQQAGLLTPRRTGPACDGHKVPQPPKSCSLLQSERRLSSMQNSSGLQKPPLLSFFAAASVCSLAQSQSLAGTSGGTSLPFVSRSTPRSPPQVLPVFFTAPQSSCYQLMLI